MSAAAEKALLGALYDLNKAAYDGRDGEVLDELSALADNQLERLTVKQGSRVYRKKGIRFALKLMRDANLFTPIEVLGADDNRRLALIANNIINAVSRWALGVRDTGAHMDSIVVFIRNVGDNTAREHRGYIREKDLPDRAVIMIVPIIKYASALEAMVYGAEGEGVLHGAAKAAQRTYKSVLAVKYDYVGGKRVGERGGTFPRITIGFYGNVYASADTPGAGSKRHRSYASVKGRSR